MASFVNRKRDLENSKEVVGQLDARVSEVIEVPEGNSSYRKIRRA